MHWIVEIVTQLFFCINAQQKFSCHNTEQKYAVGRDEGYEDSGQAIFDSSVNKLGKIN